MCPSGDGSGVREGGQRPDARRAPERPGDDGHRGEVAERGHDRRVPGQRGRARRDRAGHPPGERVLVGGLLPVYGRRGELDERPRPRVPWGHVARGALVPRARGGLDHRERSRDQRGSRGTRVPRVALVRSHDDAVRRMGRTDPVLGLRSYIRLHVGRLRRTRYPERQARRAGELPRHGQGVDRGRRHRRALRRVPVHALGALRELGRLRPHCVPAVHGRRPVVDPDHPPEPPSEHPEPGHDRRGWAGRRGVCRLGGFPQGPDPVHAVPRLRRDVRAGARDCVHRSRARTPARECVPPGQLPANRGEPEDGFGVRDVGGLRDG